MEKRACLFFIHNAFFMRLYFDGPTIKTLVDFIKAYISMAIEI